MGLFDKFVTSLQKARVHLERYITYKELSYDDLETALIQSDFGVAMTNQIVNAVKDRCNLDLSLDNVARIAEEEIVSVFPSSKAQLNTAQAKPTVILIVGVNGTGKTTSAAKLAHLLMADRKKVILAAADTFRAAAIEQLKLWGTRIGCDVVAGQYGGDPASVTHDAISKAIKDDADYVIIDTAGRLHNKHNLMAELEKMKRVVGKKDSTAPHEVILVVDGSTGGNAMNQAREFNKVTPLTGIIVTKLDGTSKGGVVVAIQKELGIPVKFVGLGEKAEDLVAFDPHGFARGLFARAVSS
ncbi:MAG: signal recognition particle-docking protein FtsY [Verrucomicrobiota bacterium]|nr:signal recognition particle-docking protein FtsY [Verrucomicrobiota bacterium]